MRILVLFGLFLGASAFTAVKVSTNYHIDIGIPAATRIKEAEDRILANGGNTGDRIVGGSEAPQNAHPYLAGLLISFFNNPGLSACGASLISSNRLVTAAHCWDVPGNLYVSQFLVVLGSHYLFTGGTRIATSNVVVHPEWYSPYLTNDVAVIYLPYSVTFSPSILPIELPPNVWDDFVGVIATAAGYGKTSNAQAGVSSSSMVSHVNLQVITVWQCSLVYGTNFVRDSTLCTDGTGGIGVCGGDSGGPLVVNRDGRNILVGISSFTASNNCEGGYPSGFARVTSFRDFIVQHLY